MPKVVRASEARRTETPNATMTTLASPTLGATAGLSLWRVEMAAGAAGPWHRFDSEQLWSVEAGTIEIAGPDGAATLTAGDSVVLAAGTERRVGATTDARAVVCGLGDAVVHAAGEDAPRGTPPWIA